MSPHSSAPTAKRSIAQSVCGGKPSSARSHNGNLDASLLTDPAVARVGLTAFNDVILRVAFEAHLSVIDLRLVCSEPADYANPIEPSSRGGEKIAHAVLRALGLSGDASPSSLVFTG